MSPDDVVSNTALLYLGLAECRIRHLASLALDNLHSLDLGYNRLTVLRDDHFVHLPNLRTLTLAGNPLLSFFSESSNLTKTVPSLRALDVSHVDVPEIIIPGNFVFPNLQTLNLSHSGVQRVLGAGFRPLTQLRVLDLRGCPLTDFPPALFAGLARLQALHADNYKLCCPAVLPEDFNLNKCAAPSDELSSCEALLRSDLYRAVLTLFAVLSILGNLGSFAYRVLINTAANNTGFGVLVTHLCVSDFLMGVYLVVVGVADHLFRGSYLWKESRWKTSKACAMAGFLSLTACEVSAFIICLITLERFVVLRFPFSNLRFRKWSAHLACGLAWTAGGVLAAVPLLPPAAHWRFYSHTGICIPLPVSRRHFAGHDYSFGVLIVFNFVLFLLIGSGQVLIYLSVRANRLTTNDSRPKDLKVARRLLTVAVSDFLCWFPIGVVGLLAANGVPVPGEVGVAMAIVVLPLNSALNPFLYTYNIMAERRQQAREKRVRQVLLARMTERKRQQAT